MSFPITIHTVSSHTSPNPRLEKMVSFGGTPLHSHVGWWEAGPVAYANLKNCAISPMFEENILPRNKNTRLNIILESLFLWLIYQLDTRQFEKITTAEGRQVGEALASCEALRSDLSLSPLSHQSVDVSTEAWRSFSSLVWQAFGRIHTER